MTQDRLAWLFSTYLVALVMTLAILLRRYLKPRQFAVGLAVLAGWLLYGAVIGFAGVMHTTSPAVVVLPLLVFFMALMGRSPAGRAVVASVPLVVLIALETFRVGVELTLHALWRNGLLPHLMTLEGGNVEIVVAALAPVAAWAATRGRVGRKVALGWNVLGVLSLINVVTRAVLTAPGVLHLVHAEVDTVGIAFAPFSFIPTFMVPLALTTHVLIFKALRRADSES